MRQLHKPWNEEVPTSWKALENEKKSVKKMRSEKKKINLLKYDIINEEIVVVLLFFRERKTGESD